MDDTERLNICQRALGRILTEHDKALERLRRETNLYESARFSQSADAAAMATRALFQTSALSAQNALVRMRTALLAVTTAQAIIKADEVEACLLDSGYQCRSRPQPDRRSELDVVSCASLKADPDLKRSHRRPMGRAYAAFNVQR